jgi:hypothetical protein|eukprot:COSAG06_NODE_3936_length_4747_cov_6.077238_6_plen_71_part_00
MPAAPSACWRQSRSRRRSRARHSERTGGDSKRFQSGCDRTACRSFGRCAAGWISPLLKQQEQEQQHPQHP